jgi:hypothetical protein
MQQKTELKCELNTNQLTTSTNTALGIMKGHATPEDKENLKQLNKLWNNEHSFTKTENNRKTQRANKGGIKKG